MAAGSISRIRMNRGGTTAVSEDLAINVYGDYANQLTITVDNGDDPAIPLIEFNRKASNAVSTSSRKEKRA